MSYLHSQHGVPIDCIFARWKEVNPGGDRKSYPTEDGIVTIVQGPVKSMEEFRATFWRSFYREVMTYWWKDPYPDTEEFRRMERRPGTGITLAPGESISVEEVLKIQQTEEEKSNE